MAFAYVVRYISDYIMLSLDGEDFPMSDKVHLKVEGGVWLSQDGAQLLGERRFALLEQIGKLGSISQAAKAVGMSYKAAWDALDAMNQVAGEPLVKSASGGKGGGGTKLAPAAEKLLAAYRLVQEEHRRFLSLASQGIEDFDHFYRLIRRLSMKTSARNQFFGQVSSIRAGPVHAEVEVTLKGGAKLHAVITHESLQTLGLKAGDEVWALVKAPWVIVTRDDQAMKLSARNRLCGTLTRLNRGSVNTDVVITLPGGTTVGAVITNESAQNMALKEGEKACAVFKASSVILGVNV